MLLQRYGRSRTLSRAGAGPQQVLRRLGGEGFGEVVALGEVAAQSLALLELFSLLHALGVYREAQGVPEGDEAEIKASSSASLNLPTNERSTLR